MAGTVIDSLVLEFSLDASKFTADQRKMVAQLRDFEHQSVGVGKQIESHARRAAGVLSDFRREAITALGLFLGGQGIKTAFTNVMNLDAAVGRLSHTLQTDVREVSAWQGAIRMSGGSAEGASAALAGLSGEMSRFQLTGQSGMLPVMSRLGVSLYDQNRRLKTSSQLWLELADAVRGMDPREAASFLAMIPGANQDMINFALQGREAMERYIAAAKAAGTASQDSAELGKQFVAVSAQMDQSATSLYRTLTVLTGPAIIKAMESLTRLFQSWNVEPGTAAAHRMDATSEDNNVKLGSAHAFLTMLGMGKLADEWWGSPEQELATRRRNAAASRAQAAKMDAASTPSGTAPTAGGYGGIPTAVVEAKIRAAAAARGIDPNVALAVAKAEGLYNYKSTIPGEESYGPFQLYYGSKGGGGLGTVFTRRTGLDARDPATLDAQIGFALDHALRNGWGAWYGWKGDRRAGLPGSARRGASAAGMAPGALAGNLAGGLPSGGTPLAVQIGEINVNAPRATNAEEISREIGPAIERNAFVGAATWGQN